MQLVEGAVHPRGVDVRAAAALEIWLFGRHADHRHTAYILQRQQIALVLEQDHRLSGDAARQRVMRVDIDGRATLRRLLRLADDGQQPLHRCVERGFVQLATAHRFHDSPRALRLRSGHLQVQPGGQRRDPVVHRTPVRHDHAFKAPLFLEHLRQQVMVLRSVRAVQAVIGAHHRPGLGFLHRVLERGEVQFVQRAFVNLRVDGETLFFLVVGSEVLQRRANALALYAVNQASRHAPGEVRIFGEILEVAPAQRRALHIGAGAEHDVHVQRDALVGQCLSQLADQLDVPRRGQRRGGGEARRGHNVARKAAGRAPHAVRPVRHNDRRKAQPLNGHGIPGRQAGTKCCFFFQSHLFKKRFQIHKAFFAPVDRPVNTREPMRQAFPNPGQSPRALMIK